MAKLVGRNALCYLGGTEVPQRNQWSLQTSRELQEARVFQAVGSGNWVENDTGFQSWSGSLNGYYDNASDVLTDAALGDASKQIVLYEDRATLTRYWYGTAWVEMDQTTGVDAYTELNVSFTGTGALTRITP